MKDSFIICVSLYVNDLCWTSAWESQFGSISATSAFRPLLKPQSTHMFMLSMINRLPVFVSAVGLKSKQHDAESN